MSSKDAMMFPIVGSCVLFGLFLLFKFFAKEYLNMLFTFYFLIIGLFAVGMTILPAIQVTPQTQPTEARGRTAWLENRARVGLESVAMCVGENGASSLS